MNVLEAAILWLAGQGFLMIPQRMEPLVQGLPPAVAYFLGGLSILAALSAVFAGFIIFRWLSRLILNLFSLLVLGLLAWLFMRPGYYIETALLASLMTGLIFNILYISPEKRDDSRTLLASLSAASLISSFLFAVAQARFLNLAFLDQPVFRYSFAGLFLISGLLGALGLTRPAGERKAFWFQILAIPWLVWMSASVVHVELLPLLVALPPAALLISATLIPWNQFVLPETDRIGRRLAYVSAIILCISIASFSALLWLLKASAPERAIANDFLLIGDLAFLVFTLISCLVLYGTSSAAMIVHSLMSLEADAAGISNTTPRINSWRDRIARYLQPFSLTREGLRARLEAQSEQLDLLSRQLASERNRIEQLTLLNELSQQLEANLDPPVAAQLAVNTIERALECSVVCLYLHEPERREFVALASSGRIARRPAPGYRQNVNTGVLGRVNRQRKTQVIGDTRLDPDYIPSEGENERPTLSYIAVPLISTGHVRGVIEIESEQLEAFSTSEVALAERMATELLRAWERSSYHTRLMDLIQAGISLSTMVEPEATVQELASIAKQTLEARFVYISLLFDREEKLVQRAHAGQAPRLLRSLEKDTAQDGLLKASLNATQPFRVRDVRKYASHSRLEVDHNGLRSLLVVPIRLHRLNIGAILVFGKQKEVFFTENDESLANLLASQAAAAIESVWLQQELRTTLRTTRLLYELSFHIIQAEDLSEAAQHIATTAHKLAEATVTGIMLFKPDGTIATEVQVDAAGTRIGGTHPMESIEKVFKTGRVVYQSLDKNLSRLCLPIQSSSRKLGAIWLTVPENRGYRSGSPADLQTLTNQAALALERAILMVETRHQAREIEGAFHELELAYDRTLAGLISALDARDRETEGHSSRVSQLTTRLGASLGLTPQELKALERGALLHDIGKIGVSDTILHKPGPLTEAEWRQMHLHPNIGARIIEGIPFLQASLPVIRSHHERWDGSGYPQGLQGTDIPWLARIFSVVDAFDALTSDRPYRRRIPPAEALAYLRGQAGNLFDPEVVGQFEQLVTEDTIDHIIPD